MAKRILDRETKYNPQDIEKKWPDSAETSQGKHDYNPQEIEKRWQEVWATNKTYSPDLDTAKNPFYNLMMFPYPSAEGLHVGNMYAFTGADIYGRFMRMQGYSVFEPIGLDGFGIHSENYAIKVGRHPKEQAEISQKNFYRQLHEIGNSYDWTRTVETYDPGYYKWTQWIFIQMFKKGLAYRKTATVNFCPKDKTVLADEQVINGKCERCDTPVEKKSLEQWFFKITDYAERLLGNIEKLDWTEKVKIAQQNWIGKSKGAKIRFKIHDSRFRNEDSFIEVFTTRPDTLYGATFLVVAPEHPIVALLLNSKLLTHNSKLEDIKKYVEGVKFKTDQERVEEGKEKTGVFSGLYAVNPVNGKKIPVWIADYVLSGYGTGAIMGVPAHDERDFEFAKKYGLMIRPVIVKDSSFARSFLIGAEDISDEDLKSLHIKILKNNDKVRLIEIPFDSLHKYEALISEKLTPGFWNEHIGPVDTVFLFKFKDGKIKRIELTDDTEKEIDRLAAEFNNQNIPEETNVWGWLSENEWYKDLLIHDAPGRIVASGPWDQYYVPAAMEKIFTDLATRKIGTAESQYHLRDWLISRQRYWGPPIPMIFCKRCAEKGESWFTTEEARERFKIYDLGSKNEKKDHTSHFVNLTSEMKGWYPVPEDGLPVLLPDVSDWRPKGDNESPLAGIPSFVKVTCPSCGNPARRETDVSDTFLDSAWYYLRYLATDWDDVPFPSEKFTQNSKNQNNKEFKSASITKRIRWLPVPMYIGGAEHAVLHLLYVRFFTMVLHDLGYLNFEESFPRFFAHGLLIKEGAKMSKSRGNIIVPDTYIQKYGSDTLRCYLMFIGPFSQGGDFYDTGIEGMNRFLKRVWTLLNRTYNSELITQNLETERKKMLHKTIKGVTEDLENLSYNTAISKMMEWYNFLNSELTNQDLKISKEETMVFLKLLAPMAPHITEELYQQLQLEDDKGQDSHDKFKSIHLQSWPTYDPKFLEESEALIIVQVNGKKRGELQVQSSKVNSQAEIEREAKKRIEKYIGGQTIRKTIYVQGKIINFVV